MCLLSLSGPVCLGVACWSDYLDGMSNDDQQDGTDKATIPSPDAAPRVLSPEARRALAEAEERRKIARQAELAPETGGRKGPEPTRFGDWEKKGIICDF